MEEKKYLSKKTKRKNDKNIPLYTQQDELKYNEKNKILKKEKQPKIKETEQNEEINSSENEDDKNQYEENELNELIDKEQTNDNNMYNKIKKKLIIILEGASLELGNLKKNPQIINCDDHYKIIKSMKKKLDEFRPDIIHQCLLNLFDSPLNKVGLLQVYIHTNKNILIEINPKTRTSFSLSISTFFCGTHVCSSTKKLFPGSGNSRHAEVKSSVSARSKPP